MVAGAFGLDTTLCCCVNFFVTSSTNGNDQYLNRLAIYSINNARVACSEPLTACKTGPQGLAA